MRGRWFFLGWVVLAGLACGHAQPRVKVLGLSPVKSSGVTTAIVVVVDIHNPTGTQLRLSGLDYRFQADPWFEASGTVVLRRALPAGASATVEIPVPVKDTVFRGSTLAQGVRYRLKGRLRAYEGPVEVTYRVDTSGEVAPEADPSSLRVELSPGTQVSLRSGDAHD